MPSLRPALALAALLFASAAAAQSPKADQRPTVAVLYFDYTGKSEELGVLRKGLAQMLISDLGAVDAVRIVERDRLQEILAELKLQGTAKIDPASASKVGKLLGARYMLLGGYFDLLGALRVDARLVEVETGKIVHSVGANGTPGEFLAVEQKVAEAVSLGLAAREERGSRPRQPRETEEGDRDRVSMGTYVDRRVIRESLEADIEEEAS